MNIINFIGLAFVAALVTPIVTSCNNYDFDQNVYPHKVSLMAGSDRIYDRTTVNLSAVEDGTASIKLVATLSGSLLADRDYHVTVAHDDSLFNAYNKSNFDVDSSKFAHLLPAEYYEDSSLSGTISAGTNKCTFDIKLKNLDKLSPDSTYFLDYKIIQHDAEAIATDNNKLDSRLDHVLLKITWKNDYASTATAYNYQLTSTQVINNDTKSVARPTNTVRAFSIDAHSVRFLAGDESYSDYTKALHDINVKSIIVTVNSQTATNPDAYNISIKPYKSDSLEVETLTPYGEYDNTFLLNKIGGSASSNATYYKEFRLHYKYRILTNTKQKDGTWTPGPWKEVLCKMRYQYNPRADQL
ncbi:BT_3044 domain-containing protein [Hallella multisaccharivorax]|uniref:BT_3044 domain-containing protein n=1 Tax=Hallella multisaccharivorax TaxID=310514 RepID=UPI0036180597